MNVRIYSLRTRNGATVWLWDWFWAILFVVLGLLGLAAVWKHLPSWALAGLPAACILTRRIRISRDEPATARVTTRFDVQRLHATHSDDWSTEADEPYDSIESGSWSLVCRHPDDIAAWLKASSADLSTPRADVRR